MLFGMKRQTDPDVLLLQAAADPTRLAILRQLSDAPEVCACDFTACCDVSQPTVSHQTDPDVLLLQAAADPTRLAILRQLSDAPEVCACDFTACCDVSQPTVSH